MSNCSPGQFIGKKRQLLVDSTFKGPLSREAYNIHVFSVSDEDRIPALSYFDSNRVIILTSHQLLSEYFVEAKNETDTIQLLLSFTDTECCGRRTQVDQISLNATVLSS